jgi:hypothetical protein
MSITHSPETGWGFTHGQQTYTGFATREAAAEALYDVERGIEPSAPTSAPTAPAVSYSRVGVGDGSSPRTWDEYECGECALAIDGDLLLLYGPGVDMGQWTRDELAELRALLNDPRILAVIGGQAIDDYERGRLDGCRYAARYGSMIGQAASPPASARPPLTREQALAHAQTAEEYAAHMRRQAELAA